MSTTAKLQMAVLLVGIIVLWVMLLIALRPHDWRQDEVPPTTYADIARDLPNDDATERQMVKRFMADGKITYSELEQLNAYDQRVLDAAVPLKDVKQELAQ